MVSLRFETEKHKIQVQLTTGNCWYIKITSNKLNRIILHEQICFDEEGNVTHHHFKKPRVLRLLMEKIMLEEVEVKKNG